MTSKLACALVFTAVLALGAASAQTSDRGVVMQGGPLVDTAPQRARALTNAELSARVIQLEAQVAQLASRVEMLNEKAALVEGYPTHRHNFNDDVGGGPAAHDVTGLPHQ
jgi:hypothetical protein